MADLNKKKKENRIKFDGNFLTLIRPSKTRRKFIVSKTFMKLWFKTIENDFDEQLYELMDEKNKKLFIETYVFWLNQVPNTTMQTSFEIYRADISKPFVEKLKVIEGSIMAGNLNQELVKQYEDVLQDLVDYHFMTSRQRTMLLKRIKLTHELLEESDGIINNLQN